MGKIGAWTFGGLEVGIGLAWEMGLGLQEWMKMTRVNPGRTNVSPAIGLRL